MIHAAARGEPYACFVRPDTRIPFMAMPDAIEALLKLSVAQPNRLSCIGVQRARVQSVGRRDSRVGAARVSRRAASPIQVDAKRQAIVDSWPEDVDDTSARRDWDFAPAYDFDRAFHEYLIPTIRATYK